MQYPKKIMSISELIEMGFSRYDLYAYYHRRGQSYARKSPGNGKIMFDTEKFEKFRMKMV